MSNLEKYARQIEKASNEVHSHFKNSDQMRSDYMLDKVVTQAAKKHNVKIKTLKRILI